MDVHLEPAVGRLLLQDIAYLRTVARAAEFATRTERFIL
jgi:hypothetical protein